MTAKTTALSSLLTVAAGLIIGCNRPEERQIDVPEILPGRSDDAVWRIADPPQIAVGQDLFTLINGGAEIFHEYGFERAITCYYENDNQKEIGVEIYEMASPESAFGVYSFRTGDEGKRLPIGDEAFLESYYLNFWKGRYVVTVIGFDTDEETMEGILQLAGTIDKRIEGGGRKPQMVELLPADNLNEASVVYLKGQIALLDTYQFDTANIFGVQEGVIGKYGESILFIFRYDNEELCLDWFQRARDHLSGKGGFSDFVGDERASSMTDPDGRRILCTAFRNTILIVLAQTLEDARQLVAEAKKAVDRAPL